MSQHGVARLIFTRVPCGNPKQHRPQADRRNFRRHAKAVVEETVQFHTACSTATSDLKGGGFKNGNTAFVEQYRVRSCEVGPDRMATIPKIADLLQETASNHVMCLWGKSAEGFAIDPIMMERNLIFVMTRLQLQIEEHPAWGDLIEIETWFNVESRASARRDWIIRCTTTKKIMGRATSTWVMVDTTKRRMARIPSEMTEKWASYCPQERFSIESKDARQKLPELNNSTQPGPIRVARHSNEDMNGHINNVVYMVWALDTVPDDMHNSHRLTEVELDFKAECNAGDCVESSSCRVLDEGDSTHDTVLLHSLQKCNGSSCVELIRLRSKWTRL